MDIIKEIKKLEEDKKEAEKYWFKVKEDQKSFFNGEYEKIENDDEFIFQLKRWLSQNRLLVPSDYTPIYSFLESYKNVLKVIEGKEELKLVRDKYVKDLEEKITEHQKRREKVIQRLMDIRKKDVIKLQTSILTNLISLIPNCGGVITIITTLIDMTKRKKLEKQYEDVEERLIQLIDYRNYN